MDIEGFRRNYQESSLDIKDLSPDPIEQFRAWFKVAEESPSAEWFESNAATLATAGADGDVSARIILLKQFGPEGFAFFTNYMSDKAKQIAENPHASLVFYWPHVEKQIRIDGRVTKTDAKTSDKYFHARPRGSQIGAVASPQSKSVTDRDELEAAVKKITDEVGEGPITRPEHWGGYLLVPECMEFWQGRPNRLHDRFRYHPKGDASWSITRLAP